MWKASSTINPRFESRYVWPPGQDTVALVDLKALSACTLLTVAWERTYRYFSFHITDTQDLLPGVGRLTLLQLYDGISERALRDPSKFTTYSYRSVSVPKLSFIFSFCYCFFLLVVGMLLCWWNRPRHQHLDDAVSLVWMIIWLKCCPASQWHPIQRHALEYDLSRPPWESSPTKDDLSLRTSLKVGLWLAFLCPHSDTRFWGTTPLLISPSAYDLSIRHSHRAPVFV